MLDNGLIFTIRSDTGEKIASLQIKIKAGLSSEQEYSGSGISHYVEHMIFKGTPETGTGALAKEVRKYGGYINATTSLDSTTYYITVPSEYISECVHLLADAVMNPAFDTDEAEKEKEVILNEIRLHEDDPSRNILRTLFDSAYIKHSYKFPIIGYEALLKKITVEDLRKYHSDYYIPNNIVVSAAGNFDKTKVETAIKEAFGKYERKPYPVFVTDTEPEQFYYRRIEKKAETNLGYIAIGFHSTSLIDKDLFAVDILASILGQGNGSRLNEALVKMNQTLYSVGAFNFTPQYPGLFIINGVGDPENIERAEKEIFEQLKKIINGGVTAKEYEKAKAQSISSYLREQENVNGQASSMAQGQMFAGTHEFDKIYLEGIRNVTPDDIKTVALKYLNKRNATVVALLPEWYENSSQNNEKLSGAGTKTDTETTIFQSANGVRVILKPKRDIPIVYIKAACLGGVRSENEELNGICDLVSNMLLKGTKSKKEGDIKPAMENIGAHISAFSGLNSFGVSLDCMSKDVDFTLNMLYDVLANPEFPEVELDKMKQLTEAEIKRQDNDTFKKAMLAMRKGLFPGSAYGRRVKGEIESVKNISREDLKDYYSSVFSPSRLVISIVGDFDSDEMRKKADKLFRLFKKNKITRDHTAETVPAKKGNELIKMPKEEAVFVTGFRGVTVSDEDQYPLEVLFSVLSGMGGRLFTSVRDKFGYSYSQGGASVAGLDAGYMFLYAATDKEDLEKTKDIILGEVDKITSEKITEEELKIAKNYLIGRQKMSLESGAEKASVMALNELYDLGYDYYTKYEGKIKKCNREDVLRVAQKYLDVNRAYTVSVIPEK